MRKMSCNRCTLQHKFAPIGRERVIKKPWFICLDRLLRLRVVTISRMIDLELENLMILLTRTKESYYVFADCINPCKSGIWNCVWTKNFVKKRKESIIEFNCLDLILYLFFFNHLLNPWFKYNLRECLIR